MAQKDAAFQAYMALHFAGLVNDNMLPARQETDDQAAQFQIPDHRPALVEVAPPFDPWISVARSQQDNPRMYYRTLLQVSTDGEEPTRMILLTSILLTTIPEIVLYWNSHKQYRVQTSSLPGTSLADEEIQTLQYITRKLLHSMYGGRMQEERYDFLWLLAPCESSGAMMDHAALSDWKKSVDGQHTLAEHLKVGAIDVAACGLISQHGDLRKYRLKDQDPIDFEDSSIQGTLTVQAIRMPKRRDFLHKILEVTDGPPARTRYENLPVSECIVDNLPIRFSIFALLFPSILHKIGLYLMTETLRTSQLKPVSFESEHVPLLVRALTSSSTDDEDYQRLEFLGDCVLKFISSVHLMAAYLTWPESFLTGKKGKIVSNGFLARATLAAGLDKYMITKRFTGLKWKPRYAGDILSDSEPAEKIQRSSKVIADIIESLIGASYLVGGLEKAFTCIRVLLPLEPWTPLTEANEILHKAVPEEEMLKTLDVLESLIQYMFDKKALLMEALTHASYVGPNAHSSYERLEFLGDAVLDYIVSRRLYAHSPELTPRKMHAMRTAMVNASYLAFRMLDTTVEEEVGNKLTTEVEVHQRVLWQFMRSGSPQLIGNRAAALRQHEAARVQIIDALKHDARFPWHLLSLTDPPKFLSDIVESIVGAIYVDTKGDIVACERFVRRLGILDNLERILQDDVDCLHPKERLGHLAVEKDVRYVRVTVDDNEGNNGKMAYSCQVKVGGVEVGGVVEGVKKLNAETIAAWKAASILEGLCDVVMSEDEGDDEFFDAESGGGVMVQDW